MERVADDLRPDKCGIIFDRIAQDVISARLEEGRKLSALVLAQINAFINEGFSVIVFRGQEHKTFLLDHHTQDYVKEIVHGRAELH